MSPIKPMRILETQSNRTQGNEMNRKKMKKPSNGCHRNLGQQQNFPSQVAMGDHTKGKADTTFFRRITLPLPSDFYAGEIVAFHEVSGGRASGCCPFHDDRNHSLAMNLETGSFYCRSSNCGLSGNNVVAYVCAKYGLSVGDAFRLLEDLA